MYLEGDTFSKMFGEIGQSAFGCNFWMRIVSSLKRRITMLSFQVGRCLIGTATLGSKRSLRIPLPVTNGQIFIFYLTA